MDTLPKKRIALIGLGDIAEKAYLPIVGCHINIEPVLCTRNTETLARLASQYRIKETYTDIDALILARPDAAMVHSSTSSHYTIVKKLLQAGIPAFVDKPLSYSIKECDELLDLSIETQTLLYLGFNRRFAPFILKISSETDPLQITWQKNRAYLPGDMRVFVFDDFIHVIDSLLFLANGIVSNLQVKSLQQNGQLQGIQVHWQQGETLVQGSMNRVSGYIHEHVEYYTSGNTWHINDFSSCSHFSNERHEILNSASWDSALFKKGFHYMIDDWLNAIQATEFNIDRVESIRATHHLCEEILKKMTLL